MNVSKFKIGKVSIAVTSPHHVVANIKSILQNGDSGYICVSNVRTVRYANKHKDYCKVMAESLMNIPDGMPLIWLARLWGIKNAMRTNGPSLFKNMIEDTKGGLKHFLLGDTTSTLDKIIRKMGDAKQNVVGMISPPFCRLDEYEFDIYAKQIINSGANIVWVSLGAPKQDFFAKKISEIIKLYTDRGIVIIGVGAAFRFYIGEYKEPSRKLQHWGLTGFYVRKLTLKVLYLYISYFIWLTYSSLVILLQRVFRVKSIE